MLIPFRDSGMDPFSYHEYVMHNARNESERAHAFGTMFQALWNHDTQNASMQAQSNSRKRINYYNV